MSTGDGEGLGPLEIGRKRYKQKEYTKALDAFTEAVKISDGSLQLTALDHRAATLEKLEQLQPALRDSKKMIDLKPDRAKGYLRCGKILQLKGEQALALKIYERGLIKVRFGTDDERITLQSMFNKLLRAQNPRKSLDPLEYLPIELATMVAQNLNMRDRVVCLRVSKAWKKLLEGSHKLWTTFDTTNARRPVGQNALKVYLRRSNYTLERAIVHSKAYFDNTKWTYLARTCKNLNHITVNGAGRIGDSLAVAIPLASNLTSLIIAASRDISFAAVIGILNQCRKTIVDASFQSVLPSTSSPPLPQLEALQRLDIRSRLFQTLPEMISNATPASLPNLQTLTIIGFGVDTFNPELDQFMRLENVTISDARLRYLPRLPTNLKHLDISKNHQMTFPTLVEDEHWFKPHLEILNCSQTSLTYAMINELVAISLKEGRLKNFTIGNLLGGWTSEGLAASFPPSEALEELSLEGSLACEEEILQTVALYPNVWKLDVSRTYVTGVAVKQFVNMGIRWLILNECSSLSPDAVEWARGKGVEVDFNFPSRRVMGFRESMSTRF